MAPLVQSPTVETMFGSYQGYNTSHNAPIDDILTTRGQGSTQESTHEATKPTTGEPKQQSTSRLTNDALDSAATTQENGLRFVVVAHPDQLKDRKRMRQNRQHVMHNYLDKESQNPNSKDTRVRKYSSRRKTAAAAAASDQPEHRDVNGINPYLSRLTPAESVDSDSSSTAAKRSRTDSSSKGRHRTANRVPSLPEERLFIDDSPARPTSSKDTPASTQAIPSPLQTNRLGSNLNPFGTWPSFEDTELDVPELKFSCSQRFGTRGLSVHWVPTLLKARHAFLSSLCISASHDHLMQRNLLPLAKRDSDPRLAASLMKRLRVRSEVIGLINESIKDQDMRVSDETIVAVLQVLNSEIMGCDDRSMRIHQSGLHQMVRERGGLEQLGINGQLASILTITMFLLAALRETHPHQDYMRYAARHATPIPSDVSRLPESPIYCRPDGYQRINAVLAHQGDTYSLLDTVRMMTVELFNHKTISASEQRRSMSDLRNTIFALKPGWEKDFDDMNARYTYESLRLISVVYVHSLSRRIPFSRAAAELGDPNTRPAAVVLPDEPVPLSVMIMNALMRTDTSACWNHGMAGVLFWAALVAGAAASPGPFANEERASEAEDSRKWISAISVRCCIVLSFEYGSAVLETLKRLVAMQTLLANDADVEKDVATTWTEVDFAKDLSEEVLRPTPRAFSDFAMDFMDM